MATFIRKVHQLVGSDGVKDTDGRAKAKAKNIQHKPKSLCHGDLSLWRDVMSDSSCWHTRLVTKTHHYSVVTSRQDGNELTLITVFARIMKTFFAARCQYTYVSLEISQGQGQ